MLTNHERLAGTKTTKDILLCKKTITGQQKLKVYLELYRSREIIVNSIY